MPRTAKTRLLSTASLSLLILSIAAFMTRALPLSMSRLPFNNDSMTELGITSEILSSGHLQFAPGTFWYGTHSINTPILNVVLAFFSSLLGVEPEACAQLLASMIAIVTIGGVFLLGRAVSGELRGGVVAGLAAVLFGTFAFTTGSVWKEMLGLSLMVLSFYAFVRRDLMPFRVLTFGLLIVIPFVHHLVAAVVFLAFANLLVWLWFHAIVNHQPKRRQLLDTFMIAIPAGVAAFYYSAVSLDRFVEVSSPLKLLLLISGFCVVSLIGILALSVTSHAKWSFAPLVGLGLTTVVLMDYFGFIFPYQPSASDLYVLLGLTTAFVVAVAWYGAELILETRARYRALQVALLISPMTIIGFGMLEGLSNSSQQVLYRSFDFLDLFLFIGLAVGLVGFRKRHIKHYGKLGAAIITSLLITFPFAYASSSLLGVRHDTQLYEVDGLMWLGEHANPESVVTDERLGYVARSTIGVPKDASLPFWLSNDEPFPPYMWYYVMEYSWTTEGVNNFPEGKFVLPEHTYDKVSAAANLFFVCGPVDDPMLILLPSEIGTHSIYDLSGY